MVFAGKLTEKLDFYSGDETQSPSGYKDISKQFKFGALAEKVKQKETITEDAEEVFHYLEITFRLRNRSVEETDMVQWNGGWYRIMSIDKYPRDNEMVIKVMKINE